MSLSSWKERVKLGALLLAVLLCLSTLLTTASFAVMGGARETSLPPLLPPSSRRALCDDRYRHLQQRHRTCERALHHAAKRLNLNASCLRREQHVILCESEWCGNHDDGDADLRQCRTECQVPRKAMRECVDVQIRASLRYFGLESAETTTETVKTAQG